MLQITIKDLDTNEVYLDKEATAIIGSIIDTAETEDEIELSTSTCIYGEGSPQVLMGALKTLNEDVKGIMFKKLLEYAPLVQALGINPVEFADMLQKDLSED